MTSSEEIVRRAEELADGLLFPDALAIDAAGTLPVAHLDALAAAGFFGLAGPVEVGGLGASPATANAVVEAFAGGCLATAFVWNQHHGTVRTIGAATPELRERWLAPLSRGTVRSGVAFGSLRRTGPPLMRAERDGRAWRLSGVAPWVSGWGLIDVVHVAARTADDDVVWGLIDAGGSETLAATGVELSALNASSTVRLELAGLRVEADRVTLIERFAAWQARDRAGLRSNGSLALGAARRCARLLEGDGVGEVASSIEAAVALARTSLDEAGVDELPAARAGATFAALDAAAALVAATGGAAAVARTQSERLFREAMFLLVFGQTAEIKAAQLKRLVTAARVGGG